MVSRVEKGYRFPFIMVWECCGHLWELIISPRFPERLDARPVCPSCGNIGATARQLKNLLRKKGRD